MAAGQQNLKAFSLSLSEEVISYLQAEALKDGLSPSALASAVLTAHVNGLLAVEAAPLPGSEITAAEAQASQ
jgi:hypothetical protein